MARQSSRASMQQLLMITTAIVLLTGIDLSSADQKTERRRSSLTNQDLRHIWSRYRRAGGGYQLANNQDLRHIFSRYRKSRPMTLVDSLGGVYSANLSPGYDGDYYSMFR